MGTTALQAAVLGFPDHECEKRMLPGWPCPSCRGHRPRPAARQCPRTGSYCEIGPDCSPRPSRPGGVADASADGRWVGAAGVGEEQRISAATLPDQAAVIEARGVLAECGAVVAPAGCQGRAKPVSRQARSQRLAEYRATKTAGRWCNG